MKPIRLSILDKIDLSQTTKVDVENWNKETWKVNYPVDYIQYVRMLNTVPPEMVDCTFMDLFKITRLYLPDTLYKFYQLDSIETGLNEIKLETLSRKEIYLSNLSNDNDPLDGRAAFYDLDEVAQHKFYRNFSGDVFEDFCDYQIGSSLTEVDFQNLSMWDKYSNKHKGYCVSYKTDRNPNIHTFAFPIQYIDSRIDITEYYLDFLDHMDYELSNQVNNGSNKIVLYKKIMIYAIILFNNIKSKSWAHEREFRISVSDKISRYLTLEPHEIYVGRNCDEVYVSRLVDIGRLLKVPVYKMAQPSKTEFGLELETLYQP